MIDKNKLFNLFDDSPQQETITSRKSLDDFIKSPFAKIGMFTKLILNHFVFHEKLKKFLDKEQPSSFHNSYCFKAQRTTLLT